METDGKINTAQITIMDGHMAYILRRLTRKSDCCIISYKVSQTIYTKMDNT